jgi:hypothetical protein
MLIGHRGGLSLTLAPDADRPPLLVALRLPLGNGLIDASGHEPGKHIHEPALCLREADTVLRASRPGEARLHAVEVELQRVRVLRLGGVGRVEEPLLLHVPLDQVDPLLGAAGEPQVPERLVVDREDGAGGSELGRHVADGGAVGERQRGQPRAIELDEAPDHALLPEHLRHGEHQVGGRGALG